MEAKLRPEHQWLQRMIGEWTIVTEASMEPGAPPVTFRGRERVRAFGLWVICDGVGETPGGGTSHNMITLGYNPTRQCFEGSFIGTTMPHMWFYAGQMDESGQRIVLDSEGPSLTDMERMGRYRDTFALAGDDHRTLSSEYQDEAGQWQHFMTASYTRVR